MGSTYLPAFSRNVSVWFGQLESYFAANNISAKHWELYVLFSVILASLTPTIKDTITDPLPGSTYESMKREVLL